MKLVNTLQIPYVLISWNYLSMIMRKNIDYTLTLLPWEDVNEGNEEIITGSLSRKDLQELVKIM